MRGRVEYVDIAKAIAIFTVVLGHVNQATTPGREWLYIDVCYAFHMPLFFLMGGFFLKPRDGYSLAGWRKFLGKNLLALIVPFALWAVIYMPFSYTRILKLAWGSWPVLLDIGTQTALWFLPVLFLARVFCEAVFNLAHALRLNPRVGALVSVPLLLAAGFLLPHHMGPGEIGNPWSCDVAFVAAAFLMIGYLARPLCDRLAEVRPVWPILVLAVSTTLFVLGFRAERPLLTFGVDHVAVMCKAVYGPWNWFLANALTGSAAVLVLAALLGRLPFGRRALVAIGTNTMGVYLLHKNVFPELKVLTGLSGDTFGEALILAVLAFAASLAILWLIVRLAPWLVGKTAGPVAAAAVKDVFSAALCREVLADGKIDFAESERLLKSVEPLAAAKGGAYAELRDALVRSRADGVISPEESEELCKLLKEIR